MEIKANNTLSYFDHGDYTITCVASLLTGKEQVYVNDQLVSDKRSFGLKSEHHFLLGEQKARIIIRVANLLKGPYIIEFWLDDQKIDTDEWGFQRIKAQTKAINANKSIWEIMGIYFLWGMAGGFVGVLVGYLVATLAKG